MLRLKWFFLPFKGQVLEKTSSVNKTLLPWQHVLQLLTFQHTERILKHLYIFIVCDNSADL